MQETRSLLLNATAIGLVMTSFAMAQEQPDAGTSVVVPVGENTEVEAGLPTLSGFAVSLDGVQIAGDPTMEDTVRRTDIALAQANVQVTFDGLGAVPRLNLETVGVARGYAAGDTVTLQSETNYPAFIDRAEMRLIDRGAAGGARLVGVVACGPQWHGRV